MRVLLHNRDHKLWIGGDAIQVQNTEKALKKHGIDVVFSGDMYNPYIDGFDIVHIFNINFFWTREAIRKCIFSGKKYVISAIFFPKEYDNSFNDMREFVNRSHKTIALSDNEKQEIIKLVKCDPNKIVVIPNGVDGSIFNKKDEQIEDYVVSIGRIQPMKGAHFALEACRRLGRKFRYISSECKGRDARTFRDHIDDYHENVSQDKVADLLRRSRVYVCPSLTERQSLGVLEAAACGVPIVDSVYNRGNKLLPSSIVVDPQNIEELTLAISKQWEAKRNNDIVPTWDYVAGELIKIYA